MGSTICVVEDDPFIRWDAITLLEDAGFRVIGFPSGDAALVYLRLHATEVTTLFTDVQMPGNCNGIALARVSAAVWPWIKLVVTSGRTRLGDGDLPANATFLPKPWRPEDILAHIP